MKTDYAWTAGFLDGEGSFLLYKSHTRQKYLSVRPYVKANQAVFPEPIERLHSLFGGHLFERNIRTVTGKRVYEWNLRDHESIADMLNKILPYLTVKRPYADLFLELFQYQMGNKYGRGGNPFLPERLAIFDRYQALRQSYHVVEPLCDP